MKIYSNTYPIDAPYGTGTIHYYNIVDRGESTEEGMRYEADYEILGDVQETPTDETRPQPKIALLTFGEYFKFNRDLSIAEGWEIGKGTERGFVMNPLAAKYNIQYDSDGNEVGYDAKLVAQISSDIQINHPDLIAGFELIDSYQPVDQSIQSIIVDITSLELLDWTLMQFSVAGSPENGLSLILSQDTQSLLTPDIIERVSSLGLNISQG